MNFDVIYEKDVNFPIRIADLITLSNYILI